MADNTTRVLDQRGLEIRLGACALGKQSNFHTGGRFLNLRLGVTVDTTTTWSSWSPLDGERAFAAATNPMIALLTWVSLFHLING